MCLELLLKQILNILKKILGFYPVLFRTRMTEETLVLLNKSFFSYIRLRRVILLRSDIRLMPSDIALWAVKGEYNITFAIAKISLCRKA